MGSPPAAPPVGAAVVAVGGGGARRPCTLCDDADTAAGELWACAECDE
eukprot:gene37198-19970_t